MIAPTRLLLPALAALLVATLGFGQRRGDRPRRGPEDGVARSLPALQPAIDEAIDSGVEYLLSRQLRDGSWSEHADEYGSGQTALSLYTLLESGLAATHPAIEAGFAYLDGSSPSKVYTVACHLLAYGELRDPGRRHRMKELLDLLVEWQAGTFGYPGAPDRGPRGDRGGEGDPGTWTDLSNTQYAALGLRAAQHVGLKVPAKTWSTLLEATFEYQEEPRAVRDDPGEGRTSSGMKDVAGFRYLLPREQPPGRGGPGERGGRRSAFGSTGSMTAAGIAVLEICRDGLGKRMKSKSSLAIDTAQRRALNWLAENFSVDENPGGGGWLNYYLYGLERVGALLGQAEIGGHDWYLEGARRLVIDQSPSGAWRGQTQEPSTCFALLFLQRATAPSTGERPPRGRIHSCGGGVCLRATGTNPLVVWITGFDEEVLREHGIETDRVRVAKIEYLVDGRAAAALDGNPRRAWRDERYAGQLSFELPGEHRVGARVHLVRPEMPRDETIGTVVLEAEGFELEVASVLAKWMVPFARHSADNLLQGRELEASASSGGNAGAAADGSQATSWLAKASDLCPSISLQLSRPIRANAIALSGPDARAEDRGEHDALACAVVTINDKIEIPVVFPADPLRPAILELDRPYSVRRLDIRLMDRVPGSGRTSTVGLAEVGLFFTR